MATRSVIRGTSMAVSVYSTVIKATRDLATLQPNVNKMELGLGPPPVAVSLAYDVLDDMVREYPLTNLVSHIFATTSN